MNGITAVADFRMVLKRIKLKGQQIRFHPFADCLIEPFAVRGIYDSVGKMHQIQP